MANKKRTERRRGSVSSRTLANGEVVWDVSLTVYETDAQGRRTRSTIRKRNKGATKQEAEDYLDRLKVEVKERRVRPSRLSDDSVVEITRRWIHVSAGLPEAHEDHLRPATAKNYLWLLRKYLEPNLGNVRINQFTAELGDEIVVELLGRGLSGATVRLAMNVLSGGFTYAVSKKRLISNPMRDVSRPSKSGGTKSALPSESIQAILDEVPPRWRAMISIAALTGARRSEVAGLTWGDVFLEGDEPRVQIRRSVHKVSDKFVIASPKSQRSLRSIPLSASGIGVLRAVKVEQAERLLALGVPQNSKVPVFDDEQALEQPIWRRPESMSNAWRAARKRAADATGDETIATIQLRWLRDQVASLLLRQLDVETAARVMGHRAQVLLDNYARPAEVAAQTKAMAQVGDTYRI